jgi:hypothetical protein
MRTIGFRSNILFAIAAACGIVASLGQPWYARTPTPAKGQPVGEIPSQMEAFFSGIGRAFSERSGMTGWVALQSADRVISGLAVATVALLLISLVPALQRQAQSLARWTALAAFGVVLVKLFDEPGANRLHEPRFGILIALGCAGVLVACAATLANAPVRRRVEVKAYTPPPVPPHMPDGSVGPPQF